MRLFYPVIAFLALSAGCFGQTPLGSILLDNFSQGDRANNDSASCNSWTTPCGKLWSLYLGEDAKQGPISFANGMMSATGDPSTGCGTTGCGLYVEFMEGQYVPPNGHAQNWIMNGTWNTGNVNRLRFRFQCNKTVHGNADSLGHSYAYIGTYTKALANTDPSNQGDHWYHTLAGDTFANHWNLVEINRHPQHQVGTAGDPGDNPSVAQGDDGYFDGLTRFYFDTTNAAVSDGAADAWSGVTCKFADVYFDTTTGNPDDKISNAVVNYDGSAYHLSFNSRPNVNESFKIRYSTSSMKANGFTSGTDGGTVSSTQNDYTFVLWSSPAMAYAPNGLYVAIQPSAGSAECASGCFTEIYYPPLDSGTAPPPPPPSNACDLNGDGSVNQTDVNLAITAALQGAPTPNLDGSGSATVVDVQRIINASMGGTCRVGQ